MRGVHPWPVNSPRKEPVARKFFIWWLHHDQDLIVLIDPEVHLGQACRKERPCCYAVGCCRVSHGINLFPRSQLIVGSRALDTKLSIRLRTLWFDPKHFEALMTCICYWRVSSLTQLLVCWLFGTQVYQNTKILHFMHLKHLPLDKMAAISQTIFSGALSFQFTITQHWVR